MTDPDQTRYPTPIDPVWHPRGARWVDPEPRWGCGDVTRMTRSVGGPTGPADTLDGPPPIEKDTLMDLTIRQRISTLVVTVGFGVVSLIATGNLYPLVTGAAGVVVDLGFRALS